MSAASELNVAVIVLMVGFVAAVAGIALCCRKAARYFSPEERARRRDKAQQQRELEEGWWRQPRNGDGAQDRSVVVAPDEEVHEQHVAAANATSSEAPREFTVDEFNPPAPCDDPAASESDGTDDVGYAVFSNCQRENMPAEDWLHPQAQWNVDEAMEENNQPTPRPIRRQIETELRDPKYPEFTTCRVRSAHKFAGGFVGGSYESQAEAESSAAAAVAVKPESELAAADLPWTTSVRWAELTKPSLRPRGPDASTAELEATRVYNPLRPELCARKAEGKVRNLADLTIVTAMNQMPLHFSFQDAAPGAGGVGRGKKSALAPAGASSLSRQDETQSEICSSEHESLSQSQSETGRSVARSAHDVLSDLVDFYHQYAPECLDEVPDVMQQWEGREEEMFETLRAFYAAKEPHHDKSGGASSRAPLALSAVEEVALSWQSQHQKLRRSTHPDRVGQSYCRQMTTLFDTIAKLMQERVQRQLQKACSAWPPVDTRKIVDPSQRKGELQNKIVQLMTMFDRDRVLYSEKIADALVEDAAESGEAAHTAVPDALAEAYNLGPASRDRCESEGDLQRRNEEEEELREWMLRLFQKVKPHMVNQVDRIMAAWRGNEDVLLDTLHQRYGDDFKVIVDEYYCAKRSVKETALQRVKKKRQQAMDAAKRKLVEFFELHAPQHVRDAEKIWWAWRGRDAMREATMQALSSLYAVPLEEVKKYWASVDAAVDWIFL